MSDECLRAVVTGAAGVLGHAVVRRLADDGWRVASLGRSSDPCEGLFRAGDLADGDSARRALDEAATWLGGVDAFVHLAGAFTWCDFANSTLDDWRRMFDANLATAVASTKAVLPHLQRSAAIVFVGARSAEPADAGFGPYAAAKSGVARLTEALAQELSPNVRVNAVLPSIIDTPQTRADMPDSDPASWTSPDAIADAIAFLASPQARAVTGALLPVVNAA